MSLGQQKKERTSKTSTQGPDQVLLYATRRSFELMHGSLTRLKHLFFSELGAENLTEKVRLSAKPCPLNWNEAFNALVVWESLRRGCIEVISITSLALRAELNPLRASGPWSRRLSPVSVVLMDESLWLPLDGTPTHGRLDPSRRWYSSTSPGRIESWVSLGGKEGLTNQFNSWQSRDRTGDLVVGRPRSYELRQTPPPKSYYPNKVMDSPPPPKPPVSLVEGGIAKMTLDETREVRDFATSLGRSVRQHSVRDKSKEDTGYLPYAVSFSLQQLEPAFNVATRALMDGQSAESCPLIDPYCSLIAVRHNWRREQWFFSCPAFEEFSRQGQK